MVHEFSSREPHWGNKPPIRVASCPAEEASTKGTPGQRWSLDVPWLFIMQGLSHSLSLNVTGHLYIYHGFRLCSFMGFLCVQTCVSLHLCEFLMFFFFFLSLFCLFCPLLTCLFFLILFSLDVCLFSKGETERIWIWLGGEMEKNWEGLGAGNHTQNILYWKIYF